nr:MAG TPA: nucelotide kinase [Caudoviricetes sp.]
MVSLKTETLLLVREVLDELTPKPGVSVFFEQEAENSPFLTVANVLDSNWLDRLEDLEGLRRVTVKLNPGSLDVKYACGDSQLEKVLGCYQPPHERAAAVWDALKAAEPYNLKAVLCDGELLVGSFNTTGNANAFTKALQRVGCLAENTGYFVTTTDPWLIAEIGKHMQVKKTTSPKQPSHDVVNHPSHYASESGLEAIEVIEAFFHGNAFLANTFKYIARAGKKGGEAKRLEDLKKARWYLEREIKREEAR